MNKLQHQLRVEVFKQDSTTGAFEPFVELDSIGIEIRLKLVDQDINNAPTSHHIKYPPKISHQHHNDSLATDIAKLLEGHNEHSEAHNGDSYPAIGDTYPHLLEKHKHSASHDPMYNPPSYTHMHHGGQTAQMTEEELTEILEGSANGLIPILSK